MKLDRNTNPDGRGKYALVKLRDVNFSSDGDVHNAIELLRERGMLCFGIEGPGEQFFVMKYSDQFTQYGLNGYLKAVLNFVDLIKNVEMAEYAEDLRMELAAILLLDHKLPD